MATWNQLQNLKKCKNKYRHKRQDIGKEETGYETFEYYCKKCGKKKIKVDAYSAKYYDEEGNFLSRRAPECVPNK